jgi:hypothetical protein
MTDDGRAEKQDSKDMVQQVVDLIAAHGCFVTPTTSPQSRRMYHDLRQLLAKHMEEVVRAQAISDGEGRTRARVFLLVQMDDSSAPKAERMQAAAMLLSGG